ncbi:MAG: 1-(5-phosphoribosyl)-5-[(5-phosphoribosylamino)methylideneamino]imidazole-4-carboxamide isomerase [Candidatus Omnitrophica bacterium]|nr:1-(5-phosphoribosyl)-5-[(5-phosphoribosylamino)methylideneamino]imidazole-4-carboxamide isomerase [Candidatus Omnitrophota bacterium]
MIPIPAIDLKEGRVVRLVQGNFKEEKVYGDKPEVVARYFEAEGALRLHVVDLEGALSGEPKNRSSVENILRCVNIPLEVGGGIRDLKAAGQYLQMGVRWILLGTKACLDKGFLKEALLEFGERVIVAIDARDGRVATDAWTRVTKVEAVSLARETERLGAKSILSTDISRDGALRGPNVKEIKKMSEAVAIDVIASGGVSALEDLASIRKLGRKNITGVVVGKALYEGRFRLGEAVKACAGEADAG